MGAMQNATVSARHVSDYHFIFHQLNQLTLVHPYTIGRVQRRVPNSTLPSTPLLPADSLAAGSLSPGSAAAPIPRVVGECGYTLGMLLPRRASCRTLHRACGPPARPLGTRMQPREITRKREVHASTSLHPLEDAISVVMPVHKCVSSPSMSDTPLALSAVPIYEPVEMNPLLEFWSSVVLTKQSSFAKNVTLSHSSITGTLRAPSCPRKSVGS
jgi:hypothetical protein